MKKYSIIDLTKFTEIKNRLYCPMGDYSEIKEFPDYCMFERGSVFGNNHIFGKHTLFSPHGGDDSQHVTRIGNHCYFGDYTTIHQTIIGMHPTFGIYINLNEHVAIGY